MKIIVLLTFIVNEIKFSQINRVSRDTWSMFLVLSSEIGDCDDYRNYDVTYAWPSVFDEFVTKQLQVCLKIFVFLKSFKTVYIISNKNSTIFSLNYLLTYFFFILTVKSWFNVFFFYLKLN